MSLENFIMADKPTDEELKQRVRELEEKPRGKAIKQPNTASFISHRAKP